MERISCQLLRHQSTNFQSTKDFNKELRKYLKNSFTKNTDLHISIWKTAYTLILIINHAPETLPHIFAYLQTSNFLKCKFQVVK